MIRLFNIEWEKLKSYRAFWVMVILYVFILASIIFGLPAFLDYLASKTDDNVAIKAFKLIVFNFPDIWQNISYVASMRAFIKIILAIIVVIIITNEFTFLTIRTNILSGMSRTEFLLGKMEVIFMLSLLSTVAIFLSGFYLGLTNSSNITTGAIVGKTIYLLAYFIEVFTFLMFAFLIAVLVRKTGFSVIILLLYPLIEVIVQYNFIPENFHKYLPLNAMNHLIWSPNTSLIKVKTPEFNMEFQEFLSFSDVVVCLLYAAFFTTIIYFYLKKKDL
jgi:ABC-type transport system involved in multi-copper enzyme maturation permease subunit